MWKGWLTMDKAIKPTSNDIKQRQKQRLFDGVAIWAAFYRYNPHRFAKDYLNVNLKLFQKILLFSMMTNHHFMYLAARGQ